MLFDISFDLSNSSHYSNHSHQSHLGINQSYYQGPVCAEKVGCCIVIGRYGYKSSFGAKNHEEKKNLPEIATNYIKKLVHTPPDPKTPQLEFNLISNKQKQKTAQMIKNKKRQLPVKRRGGTIETKTDFLKVFKWILLSFQVGISNI